MSRNDMWQPEQPSSQTVASVGLVMSWLGSSPSAARYGRNGRRSLLPSAIERPFSNSAPVGQTWTHLPQLVQVVDSPHGVPMSVTTRASMPEPITSQVWAPSISSQTRTQRMHMMQRLWSIANSGWQASMPTDGLMTGSSKWSTPQLLGQVLQLAVVVGDADRADVVALDEQHLDDRPAVLVEPLRVGRDLHALGDRGRAGRSELVRARDLDDAQAARARVGQAVEVAQRRDVDAVLACDGEDRLALGAGDVGAVDPQRVDASCGHRLRLDRADAGRADPVDDVGQVLVAEVAQRAEDRVRARPGRGRTGWCAGPCRRAAPAGPGRPWSPRPR